MRVLSFTCALIVFVATLTHGAGPKFYEDDPLLREPATQDASGAEPWDIDLFWDIASNLFGKLGDQSPDVRAQSINTVDEVPDSSWFTNRILAQPLSVSDVVRGPLLGEAPATGRWTITRPKQSGFAPGFTARDEKGALWFVSFDARGYPEAATGAILVANKLFWALGYWQVENFLVSIRPDQVVIGDNVRITPPSGKRRPMHRDDVDRVFARAHRGADGSYRAIAARALPGKIIGSFKYYGTRPDDPNDIVPHEHRRELRALKVFGAWTNLVDMKAGNTLDTVIQQDGRAVVRHYLQDVGSTFGTGANAPREWDEGWEYLYEGRTLLKRLLSFGLYTRTWEKVDYDEYPAVGRFEGKLFDPTRWKPRVPTPAFLHARPDDTFWAARRVMAFSDEMIRAIVHTGAYTDRAAEKHLADVLIQRRDAIGRAYLVAVNPLVGFALDPSGTLTFENAAVAARVAEPPTGYTARYFSFDNATQESTAIGEPQTGAAARLPSPAGLPAEAGRYIRVQVVATGSPHAAWARPVDVYFRRASTGWTLVGLER